MAVIIILKCNDEHAVLGNCFFIWKRKNLGWVNNSNISKFKLFSGYFLSFKKKREFNGMKRLISQKYEKTVWKDNVNIDFCSLSIFAQGDKIPKIYFSKLHEKFCMDSKSRYRCSGLAWSVQITYRIRLLYVHTELEMGGPFTFYEEWF